MKLLFNTLFLGLFPLAFIHAQNCLPNGITFTTQSEIDNFQVDYPNCKEILGSVQIGGADITSLLGLDALEHIGGDLKIYNNDLLSSLEGLDDLESIGGIFHLSGNDGLVNLVGLGNLEMIDDYFWIESNNGLESLVGIDKLQVLNGSLIIDDNDNLLNLNALENITEIQEDLRIRANEKVKNFQGLGNLVSVEGDLYLGGPGLTDLTGFDNLISVGATLSIATDSVKNLHGLENITNLGGALAISYNDDLESLSGLDNLESILGNCNIYNNPKLSSLSGLDKLEEIALGFTIARNDALESLDGLGSLQDVGFKLSIEDNPVLETLNGLSSELKLAGYLEIDNNLILTDVSALKNIDFSTISHLYIRDNELLASCNEPSICQYLTDGNPATISGNTGGCEDVDQILFNCNFTPKIYFDIYYDENQNKIKDGIEPTFSHANIVVDPGGFYAFPNSSGGRLLFLNSGNYQITYNDAFNEDWALTTDSSQFSITLNDSNLLDSTIFGLYPTREFSDMAATISSPAARCNEVITYDIRTDNIGTTKTDGILWFEVDTFVKDIIFIDMPDTFINNYQFGWNFQNIWPGQKVFRAIQLKIPGPPDFPLGDPILFKSYVDHNSIVGSAQSNIFEYTQIVRCSYDPNDKLVNPQRDDNLVLFEETLYYTIRFQNTGNDFARDIVIRDTLSDFLDLSTFRFLGSSHEEVLTILLENNTLAFDFRDIFLPDSTADFEGSQGYVNFSIDSKPDLPINTVINNTAHIYFDLNPPIVTNTTESILTDMLSSSNNNISFKSPLHIYPNPAVNKLFFDGLNFENAKCTIRSLTGHLVFSEAINFGNSIDISRLPSGIYFVSIETEEGILVGKIVKAN